MVPRTARQGCIWSVGLGLGFGPRGSSCAAQLAMGSRSDLNQDWLGRSRGWWRGIRGGMGPSQTSGGGGEQAHGHGSHVGIRLAFVRASARV